ncbi:MAG: ribonuclease HI [Candidatus Tectimicrobiota bacterium]
MHGHIAYTDGACLGNPGPGGWGVRLFSPDGQVCELGGREAETTNNRMEIQAAISALQVVQGQPQVTIYTDSQYLINGITKWLPAWRRRDWLTATQTPVKNRDLWQILDTLHHRGVRWRHVRGHSGDPNNERVDSIARNCAMGHCPVLFCGPAGAPDDPVPLPDPVPPPPVFGVELPAPLPAFKVGTVRYISLVQGQVALDSTWAACEARVRGKPGARYRKVRTPEELRAFCVAHGITWPAGSYKTRT